ncbi:MAG: hypothetical protein H0U27_07850 [Nitrosopumilus sp.]|nr:hypothetical protein [Nitrosopumilus sp.]
MLDTQNLSATMSIEEWKNLAIKLEVSDTIPHSWFILRENYLRYLCYTIFQITIQGIAIPVLPPVDEVTKHINDQLVESFQHDPLLEPIEYDAEVIKLLNEGKVYIGMCLIFNIILISSLIFFFFKIILSIKLFRQRNNSSSYY